MFVRLFVCGEHERQLKKLTNFTKFPGWIASGILGKTRCDFVNYVDHNLFVCVYVDQHTILPLHPELPYKYR